MSCCSGSRKAFSRRLFWLSGPLSLRGPQLCFVPFSLWLARRVRHVVQTNFRIVTPTCKLERVPPRLLHVPCHTSPVLSRLMHLNNAYRTRNQLKGLDSEESDCTTYMRPILKRVGRSIINSQMGKLRIAHKRRGPCLSLGGHAHR